MAYLEVCGYTIPIAAQGSAQVVEQIGEDARAVDGTLLSDRRGDPRRWQMQTPPVESDEAEALRLLLRGNGFVWDFEETGGSTDWQWSANGLGFSSSSGASQASGGRYGSYQLDLVDGGAVAWDTGLVGDWTIMVWRNTGSGFAHYVETSSGSYYLSGTAASQEAWFAVGSVSGQLTLQNNSGGTVAFDDLVALPFLVPPEMIAAFNGSALAFAPLPRLVFSGDFASGAAITAVCRNVRAQSLEGKLGATFSNDLRRVSFDIVEEKPTANNTVSAGAFTSDTAIAFDGVDEYADGGDLTLLDGVTNFTIAFWMRYTAATWLTLRTIFGRYSSTERQILIQTGSAGKLRLTLGNSPGPGSFIRDFAGTPLSLNTWAHITYTYANGTNLAYVDATAESLTNADQDTSIYTPANPTDMQIGKYPTAASGYWQGDLNEFAIWAGNSAAKTASALQVAEIYAGGSRTDLDNLATFGPPDFWLRPTGSTFPVLRETKAANNFAMTNMEAGDLFAV